jgi:O-antigen/teichoic acid export membrane protein
LGAIWITLIQLATLRLYLHYLGLEAYGILGVHTTFITLAALADLGLTPTLNREAARLSKSPEASVQIRSLVRSFEIAYWCLAGIFLAISLPLLPEVIVGWLHSSGELAPRLPYILRLMLVQIGLQTLVGFYSGGLLGLQRHVLLNSINVFGVTLRTVGGVLIVAFGEPTLEALFIWMIIATAIQLVLLAVGLLWILPIGPVGFRLIHLRDNWRYAVGVSGIVALSLLLTQLDKIVLSRQVSLADFGLYSLASTIAVTLSKPVSPLFNTLMPRMTQLATHGQNLELALLYHWGTQLASLLVIPASVILIVFAPEILALWLSDSDVVIRIVPTLRWLVVGFAANSLLMLPYCVSLAYGWVRFGFYQNLLACIVMVPFTIWLVSNFGAVGGGIAWALLNVVCIFASVFALHRRYLSGEYMKWYTQDVMPALVVAVAVACTARLLIGDASGHWAIAAVALAYLVSIGAVVLVLGNLRGRLTVALRSTQRK